MLTELELISLRDKLKSHLDITWVEKDDDLLDMVKGGTAYLDDIAGTKIDYTTDLIAKSLLMDYGRYAYNHSLELFEINFERELFKLSLREGIKAYEAQDTTTST